MHRLFLQHVREDRCRIADRLWCLEVKFCGQLPYSRDAGERDGRLQDLNTAVRKLLPRDVRRLAQPPLLVILDRNAK